MIAEIHHKTFSAMEDELTGNFFGAMRYMSYNRGLNFIFKSYVAGVNKDKIKKILHEVDCDKFLMEFWKRSELGFGEIDGYIEVDNVSIGIEVKYNSGLSGENQLEREASMLSLEWGKGKKKILLFVAKEEEAKSVYETNKEKEIFRDVLLGYLTWENILRGLEEIQVTNWNEEVIISDLKQYLIEKGFVSFEGFQNITVPVDGGIYYEFGK